MPFLGVLPDEQNELQIGESRKHALAPQLRAFAARGQVAALGVEAGEAEAHGRDGDDLWIVENVLADAEPAAQPDARRIGVGTARGMDPDARRLAGDANARGGRDLEDGPRLMRQGSAISRRVAANAAGADVFGERRERRASASMRSGLSEPRGPINVAVMAGLVPAVQAILGASTASVNAKSLVLTRRDADAL